MAGPQSLAWLALILILLPENVVIHGPLQARYQEALSSAGSDGLPTLLKKLDNLTVLDPSSPIAASSQEMVQVLALLHPGLVSDQAARFQKLKTNAAESPNLVRMVKRLEILQDYYASSRQNPTDSSPARLSDPVFEGSLFGLQARADAAFQARDYARAEYLAYQAIEADPYSPTLANTFLMLGLAEVYKGNAAAAARHFQRALTISPLPTLRGRTQDHLTTIHRFVRTSPSNFGELFDEELASRISGSPGLKDPRALLFHNGKFILVDREQVLILSSSGAVEETRGAREIEDMAVNRSGSHYYAREDGVDLGTGSLIRLNLTIAGKERPLRKLRSIALDSHGDMLLLDEEFGLLRCAIAGNTPRTPGVVSPTKGRLVRVDSRGYIYVLGWDRRSIQVFTREGKPFVTLSPSAAGGKETSIQSFALDIQNHVYLLDANSNAIQVFSVNEGSVGLQILKASSIPLDPRPPHKNLKVIAVSSTGEVAVTGRNEDHWVIFR